MTVTRPVTDEITPIAVYIAHEMNTNAHGPDARRMCELNTFSGTKCIAEYQRLAWWRQLMGAGITPEQCVNHQITFPQAALLAWTAKVMQGGDWDHKTTIPVKFHPRDPKAQHWHLYGDTLYYYDVWSNLHYGYVGAAASFSDTALLDGAGLEQFGSDVLRGRLPQRTGKSTLLRKFDRPEDRAAIEMGIELFKSSPRHVSATQVLMLVLPSDQITKKPYTPPGKQTE